MNLFFYSDESGVLDKVHNDYYVFGGLLFLSELDRELYSRKFLAAEQNVRLSENLAPDTEVKACYIRPKSKNKLYRAVSGVERFCAVITQKKLADHLFANKKAKQRYLDWVYTAAVRTKLESMIQSGRLQPEQVQSVSFFVDEHSTATDGRYELQEMLEGVLKNGIWDFSTMTHCDPLFPNLRSVQLQYCRSSKKTLIRAADITANYLFFHANQNHGTVPATDRLHIFYHP